MKQGHVVVVSGLPRSGTSLAMQMLDAGGLRVLTDGIRAADTDNPRGYYEYEPVKSLPSDTAWLVGARGKAVKVISQLLKHLPKDYDYDVVFMLRDMGETLASQKEMLKRRDQTDDSVSDTEMATLFQGHLSDIRRWLDAQENFRVLYLDHAETLAEPEAAAKAIAEFLAADLDTTSMAQVVDPSLHRNVRAQQH